MGEQINPLNNQNTSRQILIITGLSGAGKTILMRSLEDLGFYCVDNLPIPLLNTFLNFVFHTQSNILKVVLGIDSRGEQFLNNFISIINNLKNTGVSQFLKIIFLNSRTSTLIKRFQETRRTHPLAINIDLLSAIEKEKKLLEPIMSMSDIVLETDSFNIHELRHWVQKSFSNINTKLLVAHIISFGFKYGIPEESNLLFDVRFLPNPHFIPELKPLDGRDEKIQKFLFSYTIVQNYWEKLKNFIHFSLKNFYDEGRFSITIAIGCTGGKHRSVTFAEKLGQENIEGVKFLVTHRDTGKE
jgi:UPF0042 nucleotide-binding protein